MKHRLIIILSLIGCVSIVTAQNTPKITIGIVVDQMRFDYLKQFEPYFGKDGFVKLTRDGRSWQNMNYRYIPTFTGPGHASIYTGAGPSVHGIVANDWWVVAQNQEMYCTFDSSVSLLGGASGPGMSPANLKVNVVGDQLKSNQPVSKVYGFALKDRGAILPAGHLANGAFWYDSETGKTISSSYYFSQLPSWLDSFNTFHHASAYLSDWWPSPICGSQQYRDSFKNEKPFKGEELPVFPHQIEKIKGKGYGILRSLPAGNTYTLDLARELIMKEKLGEDPWQDMLCISLSTTDYVGHQFGTRSLELLDTYVRLDKDLADFIHWLDQRFGKNGYLLMLSSDHGAADHPEQLGNQHFYNMSKITDYVKEKLIQHFKDSLIIQEANDQWYIDKSAMARNNISWDFLLQKMNEWLKDVPGFSGLSVPEKNICTLPDEICQMTKNGYQSGRSGDIWLIMQPGWVPHYYKKGGTTHGTCYHYDTHVPFILMGYGITPGPVYEEAGIEDIAPTLCHLMGIIPPSGAVGKILQCK